MTAPDPGEGHVPSRARSEAVGFRPGSWLEYPVDLSRRGRPRVLTVRPEDP